MMAKGDRRIKAAAVLQTVMFLDGTQDITGAIQNEPGFLFPYPPPSVYSGSSILICPGAQACEAKESSRFRWRKEDQPVFPLPGTGFGIARRPGG